MEQNALFCQKPLFLFSEALIARGHLSQMEINFVQKKKQLKGESTVTATEAASEARTETGNNRQMSGAEWKQRSVNNKSGRKSAGGNTDKKC